MLLLTRLFLIGTLLWLVGCTTTGGRADSERTLAVSIPYGSQDALSAASSPFTRHQNEFYVLLTNVSGKPIRLWQEWCSWGYDCLQLEVTEKDGTKHLLKKKRTNFYRNFPDYVELGQGDSVVWRVELRASVWEDLSWLPKDRLPMVKLRALFTISEDGDSKEHGIWTGHEVSELYDFVLAAQK